MVGAKQRGLIAALRKNACEKKSDCEYNTMTKEKFLE